MDAYTAQEEAWKRGFEHGRQNAIVWNAGHDVPESVDRALLQKSGGRVFYLEGRGLRWAVDAWRDIVAWAEVVPMTEV